MSTLDAARLQDAIDVLLASPAADAPMTVAPLALDLAFPWNPSVLVIGARLPASDAHTLLEQGCDVQTVYTFREALLRMHVATWNVVVVAPTVASSGDGVRFVRAFKRAPAAMLPPSVAGLVPRYARVPFVIMPFAAGHRVRGVSRGLTLGDERHHAVAAGAGDHASESLGLGGGGASVLPHRLCCRSPGGVPSRRAAVLAHGAHVQERSRNAANPRHRPEPARVADRELHGPTLISSEPRPPSSVARAPHGRLRTSTVHK